MDYVQNISYNEICFVTVISGFSGFRWIYLVADDVSNLKPSNKVSLFKIIIYCLIDGHKNLTSTLSPFPLKRNSISKYALMFHRTS